MNFRRRARTMKRPVLIATNQAAVTPALAAAAKRHFQLKAGAACRIKQICAAADICQRLREIGFCEEQIVKRLPNQTSVICQVCNARLAVSVVLAELILVEPIEEPLEMALGA